MSRCPSCESDESSIVERVVLGEGQAADRRECSACGEQWMVPVATAPMPGADVEIESIELRDGDGGTPDGVDGVEEWFR
ncbi:hypothetical protein [Dokdonella fugitiva]|uniref:hypothetical protein n=1 Tax=Dokdonella fugitiva TaxID=328517 RepID=UPI0015F7DA20|nr:hypothetical protein [Dokdonella fugitiva]MBA8882965.1 putative Zn finger protein [Dokdonella fugitiva]